MTFRFFFRHSLYISSFRRHHAGNNIAIMWSRLRKITRDEFSVVWYAERTKEWTALEFDKCESRFVLCNWISAARRMLCCIVRFTFSHVLKAYLEMYIYTCCILVQFLQFLRCNLSSAIINTITKKCFGNTRII